MKYLIILMSLFYLQPSTAQDPYLKIETDDHNYYAYPPGTEFEVVNPKGEVLYTEDDLSQNYQIELDGNFSIVVFIDWGDGEDQFDVNKAVISLDLPEKMETGESSGLDRKNWRADQPRVVNKSFTETVNGKYNALIEFEGEIQFVYKDGEASVSEKGKQVIIEGKYIAKTSKGYLKLSYNPDSKEYWYVFTDQKGAIVHRN